MNLYNNLIILSEIVYNKYDVVKVLLHGSAAERN